MDEVQEIEKELEEQEKEIKTLGQKIDNLTEMLKSKCNIAKEITEKQIKENPMTCLVGAFVGGILVGYLLKNKK